MSIRVPTTVVHCKKEKFDLYIGRPSALGNPFSHKKDTIAKFLVSSRDEAVDKFEDYFLHDIKLLSWLIDIREKTLGCWCTPARCHGDVLAKLADLPYFAEYCLLLYQMLEARKMGMQELEDKILDEMDTVFDKLTTEGHEYVKKVSKYINW
jgi:hypothetical protein